MAASTPTEASSPCNGGQTGSSGGNSSQDMSYTDTARQTACTGREDSGVLAKLHIELGDLEKGDT